MKRILTYGTFDLLHWGHIRLLQRAKALGDYLIVAASTDEFVVDVKGARAPYHNLETRRDMLRAVRHVDLVIEETSWEQKVDDIHQYHVDTVVMGSDWQNSKRFEYLRNYCELMYLPRTEGVSTRKIRRDLLIQDTTPVQEEREEPYVVTRRMSALPPGS